MTTRERILTLADGGTEAHMIAALLGLTVTDVAETLALPGHTPADPSGGGGGVLSDSEGRPMLPCVQCRLSASGFLGSLHAILPDLGAGALGGGEHGGVFPTVQMSGWAQVEAGEICGGILEVSGPESIKSLVYAELWISNESGLERIHLEWDGAPETLVGQKGENVRATWTNEGGAGEDLSLVEEDSAIKSAAGGFFLIGCYVSLSPAR